MAFPLYDPGNGAYFDPIYNGGDIDGFISMICIDDILNSVEELIYTQENNNLYLYPNPANNVIHIIMNNFIKDPVEITIIDFTGKQIYNQRLAVNNTTNKYSLDISNLSTGIYFVNMRSLDRNYNAKFIKTK